MLNSRDAFVTKLNPSGSALVYSTLLGDIDDEAGSSIAVDAFDTTYNGGSSDAFVTKLNPAGSALVYSTFLGGSGDSSTGVSDDSGLGIALDMLCRSSTGMTGERTNNTFLGKAVWVRFRAGFLVSE